MQKETHADGFTINLNKDQEQDDLLENDPRHQEELDPEAHLQKAPREDLPVRTTGKDQLPREEHRKQGKAHRGKQTDQFAMTTTKAAVTEERSVIIGIQNHADSFHLADAMMVTSVYFHTEQQIHQQVLRSLDHNHQVPEQLRPRRRTWLWRRYSFRT